MNILQDHIDLMVSWIVLPISDLMAHESGVPYKRCSPCKAMQVPYILFALLLPGLAMVAARPGPGCRYV